VTRRIRGRVDRPAKGHPLIAAAVEELLDGHVDELDIAHPGTRRLAGPEQQLLGSLHVPMISLFLRLCQGGIMPHLTVE